MKEQVSAVLGSLKTEQERLCEVHIKLRFAQAGLPNRASGYWNKLSKRKRELSRYYGEFDPGSGRTLAACLTHASRTGLSGSLLPETPSGARVSNTWATYPEDRDNTSKGVLIPDTLAESHDLAGKEFSLLDGPASH